ncbi:mucin-5AC [Folsomia candida]|uniref:mucin-5AC n=1 Tax=Folsomia candida TaxID=158441 RepID=UPI001605511B|nr:mucin-5AC [Folsomia candida]
MFKWGMKRTKKPLVLSPSSPSSPPSSSDTKTKDNNKADVPGLPTTTELYETNTPPPTTTTTHPPTTTTKKPIFSTTTEVPKPEPIQQGRRFDRLKNLRGSTPNPGRSKTTEIPLTFDDDGKKLEDESLVIPDDDDEDNTGSVAGKGKPSTGKSSTGKSHVKNHKDKARGMKRMDRLKKFRTETTPVPTTITTEEPKSSGGSKKDNPFMPKKGKRVDRLKKFRDAETTETPMTTDVPLTFEDDGKKLADESLVIPDNDDDNPSADKKGGAQAGGAGSKPFKVYKGKRVDRLAKFRVTEPPNNGDKGGGINRAKSVPITTETPPDSDRKKLPFAINKGKRVDRLKKFRDAETTLAPTTTESPPDETTPNNKKDGGSKTKSNPFMPKKGKRVDRLKKFRDAETTEIPGTTETPLTFDDDGKKLSDESLVIPDEDEPDSSKSDAKSSTGDKTKANPSDKNGGTKKAIVGKNHAKKGEGKGQGRGMVRKQMTTEVPLTFDDDGKKLADESLVIPDDDEDGTDSVAGKKKPLTGKKHGKTQGDKARGMKRVDRLKKFNIETTPVPTTTEEPKPSGGNKKDNPFMPKKGKRVDRLKKFRDAETTENPTTTDVPLTFDDDGKKLADESLVIPDNDDDNPSADKKGGAQTGSAGNKPFKVHKGKRVDRLAKFRVTEPPNNSDKGRGINRAKSVPITTETPPNSDRKKLPFAINKGKRVDRLKKFRDAETTPAPTTTESPPEETTPSSKKNANPFLPKKGKRVDRLKKFRDAQTTQVPVTTDVPLTFDDDGKKLSDESLVIPDNDDDSSSTKGGKKSSTRDKTKANPSVGKKDDTEDKASKKAIVGKNHAKKEEGKGQGRGMVRKQITTEIPLTFDDDGKKLADESLVLPDDDDDSPSSSSKDKKFKDHGAITHKKSHPPSKIVGRSMQRGTQSEITSTTAPEAISVNKVEHTFPAPPPNSPPVGMGQWTHKLSTK